MSRAVQPGRVAPTSPSGPDEARPRTAGPVAQPLPDPDWPRRLRRPYVILPALVAVAVAVGLAMGALGDSGAAGSSTAAAATATRGPMTETVSAEGTVAAAQTDD